MFGWAQSRWVPLFHCGGRVATVKERGVVRGNRSKKEGVTGPWTERACWYPSFSNFVVA